MYGKRFGLRWVVVAAFAVFALFSLGSLFLDRYKTFDQDLSVGPTTAASLAPAQSPSPSASSLPAATATPTLRPALTATPVAGLPDDPLYLVNRQRSIPATYAPADLVALTTVRTTTSNQKVRRTILPHLEKLMADAKSAGFALTVSSAYRSYGEQEQVHAYWERALGKAEADRVSAKAGHSEHQLGTTVDLTSASVGFDLTEKFGSTPEGKWLRDNAHRYGFIISYPEGKEALTGYAYEPWHIRYVGAEHAAAIYQKGTTIEEYLRSRRP